MPSRKPAAPPDPDKLVRQRAGTYRTPDERFEVREADLGWFLVDAEQTDDFGQPLVRGPFPTLKAVGAAIPEARSRTATPRRAPKAAKQMRNRPGSPKAAPPPPPSWIDELPAAEAGIVRRLITALEAEGVEGAEALVRRDRDGLEPVVVATLIERRLDALLEPATDEARALVARVLRLLTEEGRGRRGVLPGWSLVEIGPERDPPNRRIAIRGG